MINQPDIPQEIYQTLQQEETILSYTNQPKSPLIAHFTKSQVESYLAMIKNRTVLSQTDIYLIEALNTFPAAGKNVGVLFSTNPWYESLLLSLGIQPKTIPSQSNVSLDSCLEVEKEPKPRSFDAIFLLLQLKTLGFGSTIDLDADLKAMHEAKKLLHGSGLLYLSIPVGKDRLIWNSHRIYGEKRMKKLFKGWRPQGYFGYSYEDLQKDDEELHEPVIVLKPLYSV
ncbi:MAG TPA: hypothetical protein DCE71_08300 [Parachlamydiales bacterium]|nr:hypothetical protein [Parachlamydiales bacterium]